MTETAQGLRLELEFTVADFQQEWKRCNMVANYVAEYAAYQYPRREMAENLISTVVNELLEALTPLVPATGSLSIICKETKESLVLEITHSVISKFQENFPAFLNNLEKSNSDGFYLKLLTESNESSPAFNQLGLAMLVHDFKVKIECEPQGVDVFITKVRISTRELQS